jgi:UDP-N-acetylglucosamine--N-acetylmuramyl-(pentapeptide) pyrophosphoryl-undecaprenol N-acetylglucosamine transferase
VAEALRERGCEVVLLVSPKAVDQAAVQGIVGIQVATLPAVASDRGWRPFLSGFWRAYRSSRSLFRARPPAAVLAMGGFMAAPPVLAARGFGAASFLHEANSIPGRANRWLAHVVDEAFVYFPEAAGRLWHQRVRVTGMPVRASFQPSDPAACRTALGLAPDKPLLLITGGSQGASALNDLASHVLPSLALLEPELQFVHLTGPKDVATVRQAYAAHKRCALVRPFLTEMELALGAATVALSRAGASFLAEMAALRVPGILIPYPAAAYNHQFYNARAFVETGAARLLEQSRATPETLLWELRSLLRSQCSRETIRSALAQWHYPDAAAKIADILLTTLAQAGAVAPTVTRQTAGPRPDPLGVGAAPKRSPIQGERQAALPPA